MTDLEKLRAIYLTADDVDEETRADNERQIQEWEQSLLQNEAMADWREHDITKEIARQARTTYVEASLLLARNRTLTEAKRYSLWAQQDAALWLLSTIDVDPKAAIERVQAEIKQALNATN